MLWRRLCGSMISMVDICAFDTSEIHEVDVRDNSNLRLYIHYILIVLPSCDGDGEHEREGGAAVADSSFDVSFDVDADALEATMRQHD